MGEQGTGSDLRLADAIEELREQLTLARTRSLGSELHFPIKSVQVELQVVAARDRGGKAGFKVPVIDVELGGSGSASRRATHTITIEFGAPVDPKGDPVRVERLTARPRD